MFDHLERIVQLLGQIVLVDITVDGCTLKTVGECTSNFDGMMSMS